MILSLPAQSLCAARGMNPESFRGMTRIKRLHFSKSKFRNKLELSKWWNDRNETLDLTD